MNENFELFSTKDQADTFVQGFRIALEMADYDQCFVNYPESLPTGEWRVEFGYAG